MIKTIIVEDDKMSLELLNKVLQTHFPVLEIAGLFSSPVDALEFLDDNYVDLIITDIKMPEISGIELAELATEKIPLIKIVLLSAYQDFDVALRALNSNVVSYILKPVTVEKIKQAVESVEKKMTRNTNILSFTSEYLSEKRADFANKLLNKEIVGENEISRFISELQIFINPKSVQCILIKCNIENYNEYLKSIWKHNEKNLYSAINNIINDYNTQMCFGIVYEQKQGEFSVLYFVDRDFREFFEKQISKLQKTFEVILKLSVSFTFRNSFNSVYSISVMSENEMEENILLNKIFDVDRVYSLNEEKISKYFPDINELRIFSEKIASTALKRIDLVFFEKSNYNLYEYTTCKTKEDYTSYILKTSSIIQKYKKDKPQIDLFNKVIAYIKENYMNPITLDEISSYVGFSTWFFCKFFKKHTGKNFTDYLNTYRIKEALKILNSEPDIKINILSYRVGFPTSSNFYKNFKAYTGVTPGEYLKNNKLGEWYDAKKQNKISMDHNKKL